MAIGQLSTCAAAVSLTLVWLGCSDNGQIVGTIEETYELSTGGSGGMQQKGSGGGDAPAGVTSSGGGPSLICPGDSRMSCTVPIDCESYRCGALNSSIDDRGCLRRYCSDDEECSAGERCVSIAEQTTGSSPDDCAKLWASCGMDAAGKCGCLGQGDCTGYCAAR